MRVEAESALTSCARENRKIEISFENWLDIHELPSRIAKADIVLGIFEVTSKVQRVVPNKVYQALAVGRPVITADTPAFDVRFGKSSPAPVAFTEPGNATALSTAIEQWVVAREKLAERGRAAAKLFADEFAEHRLGEALRSDLEARGIGPFPSTGANT